MPRKKATWQLLAIEDIAAFRKRKGFRSDKALAEALDVSVGSIAGWKKGVRAPSLRVQQQLVAKIEGDKKKARAAKAPKVSRETQALIKRLLELASQVKDPSALIEASQRLLLEESLS